MKILPNNKIFYVRIITCWKVQYVGNKCYIFQNNKSNTPNWSRSEVEKYIIDGIWELITQREYEDSTK